MFNVVQGVPQAPTSFDDVRCGVEALDQEFRKELLERQAVPEYARMKVGC